MRPQESNIIIMYSLGSPCHPGGASLRGPNGLRPRRLRLKQSDIAAYPDISALCWVPGCGTEQPITTAPKGGGVGSVTPDYARGDCRRPIEMSPFSRFEMSLSRVTDSPQRGRATRPARPRCSAPGSRTERKAERDTLPTSDISNRQSQRHFYWGLTATASRAHEKAGHGSAGPARVRPRFSRLVSDHIRGYEGACLAVFHTASLPCPLSRSRPASLRNRARSTRRQILRSQRQRPTIGRRPLLSG